MAEAAHLGHKAKGDPHAHGCPACPHPVQGPIVQGSSVVFINGMPAARVSDMGISIVCCGKNLFEIKKGSSTVFIEGKAAARKGDMTMHCDIGSGKIIEGSPDVDIGD
ncbi:PAAR domain-containing protein [[Eubacterium] cellulosolvens]